MRLDLRIPIGLLFAVLGLLLGIYGLASDRAIYAVSFDVNINAWWGALMLLFGAGMLGSAWASSRRPASSGR